eukprot:gene13847-13968_t
MESHMQGMEGILAAFDVPLPDRCASVEVFERFLQAVQRTQGAYSKGYLAVKRYRDKKRGKIKEMEQEVARKLAEMKRLQDEQSDLQALQPTSSAVAAGTQVVTCAMPGTDTVDSTGFPPWPLTMKETLVLHRLGRYAVQPQQATGASVDACSSSNSAAASAADSLRLLNVQTGRHEQIPGTLAELWQKAAQDIAIRPLQVQQLEAGWRVVRAAIEQLNREREQLLGQLRAAAAASASGQTGSTAGRAHLIPLSAGGVGGDGCFSKQRLSAGALDLAEYEALADSVEATLLRGRVINVMTAWSMLLIFDNEQVARMMVACYPYFPLIRGVVGCLLNKPELVDSST